MCDCKEEQEPEIDHTAESRWRKRRTVIYLTLIFCAFSITYLMIYGDDNELNNTIANGLIFLASSVVIAYVGGSAYEDTKLLTKQPRSAPQRNSRDPFR